MGIIDDIRKAIARANQEKAINDLVGLLQSRGGDSYDEAVTLQGRWSKLNRDIRRGLLDNDDAMKETNKINVAVLNILSELEKEGALSSSGTGNATAATANNYHAGNPINPVNTGNQQSQATKILFLASNPNDTSRLRLDKEVRDIEIGLRMSNYRDRFLFVDKFAVTTKTFLQAMLDHKPAIVHFSGHGSASGKDIPSGGRALAFDEPVQNSDDSGGIVLEDEATGRRQLVGAEVLAKLFSLFKPQCVLLNACYSEKQAKAIARYVPYVIGMNTAVPDQTAIEFAVGFYTALASGNDYEFSFKHARIHVEFTGITGAQIPVMLKNGEPLAD